MKLITKAIETKAARIGRDDKTPRDEKPILVKLFNPTGAATWYATEYDAETRTFFGWVTGLGFDELGYFSLDELEAFRGRMGLGIERDRHFGRHTLGEVIRGEVS